MLQVLPVADCFMWSLHFPLLLLFVLHKILAFRPSTAEQRLSNFSSLLCKDTSIAAGQRSQTSFIYVLKSPWTVGCTTRIQSVQLYTELFSENNKYFALSWPIEDNKKKISGVKSNHQQQETFSCAGCPAKLTKLLPAKLAIICTGRDHLF